MNSRLFWYMGAFCLVVLMILPPSAIADLTISSLRNGEYYIIEWNTRDKFTNKVRLINGKYEWQDLRLTDYELVEMDKVALGDLNGDGRKDAAVILWHNTGGSGSVCQVAAVLDSNGRPQHIASRNLGDRTEIKSLAIINGYIVINLDNPRFYPGQQKVVKYKLVGNKLVGPDPFK